MARSMSPSPVLSPPETYNRSLCNRNALREDSTRMTASLPKVRHLSVLVLVQTLDQTSARVENAISLRQTTANSFVQSPHAANIFAGHLPKGMAIKVIDASRRLASIRAKKDNKVISSAISRERRNLSMPARKTRSKMDGNSSRARRCKLRQRDVMARCERGKG